MPTSLKTATQIAELNSAAGSSGLPKSLAEIAIESGSDLAIEIAIDRAIAGETFEPAALEREEFRYEIARRLYDGRHFPSISAAQEFVEILAAEAAGQAIAPEMAAWLQSYRANFRQANVLKEKREIALAAEASRNSLEKEAERLRGAISFELQRLHDFDVVEAKGQQNYFYRIAGNQHVSQFAAVDFMKTWIAEKEVARFTRDVVIPEFKRQLLVVEESISSALAKPTTI